MPDAEDRLGRAARWQTERRTLSWTEKVRLIEQLLPDIRALNAARLARLKASPQTAHKPDSQQ